MDRISTVTLVRELDQRIKNYTTEDDFFDSVSDDTVQDLKVSVDGCLTQYTDVLVQRLVDNME
jgi:hypothetical protein